MAFWDTTVYDAALQVLTTNVNKIVLCSQEPTTYTQANLTYCLASKTGYTVGAPGARGGGGREVVCSAVSDGTVSTGGTATHYALISGSVLYATAALSPTQVVSSGNTWSCASFKMGIPAVS